MELMMKGLRNSSLLCISLVIGVSCQSRQQVTAPVSTIDSTLQTNATAILESKLSEINAQSGQVIVMEVQSGQIKALVGLTRKDSVNYQPCENFSVWQSTGLMHPISLLAALETGKVKLSDKVDTGNGIYQVHGRELKDHNWHRGGYGELTVQEGLAASSNIAIYNGDIYGGKKAGICASVIKPTSAISYMMLCVRNDTISDISSDNAAIQSFKEMLAETDAYMMYVLATPIETPLTADQLNAYKALRIYKGTTIIDNDAGAYMSVKYNT